MTAEDFLEKFIIPLASTFIGAFLAFRYQYSIEKRRDKRQALQNLVAYRSVGADELDWIKVMSVVDLVFHNNENVRQLYGKFLELTKPEKSHTGEYVEVYFKMLHEMAKACDYSQIKDGDLMEIYNPIALRKHYPAARRPHYFPRYRLLRRWRKH